MKTLILDESKWRCGDDSNVLANRRGKGLTAMVNQQGYYCCLGQFSTQLNKKLELSEGRGAPCNVETKIPMLNRKYNGYWDNTELSNQAIIINDNMETTVTDKVKALRKLFKPKGYKIVFRRIKN